MIFSLLLPLTAIVLLGYAVYTKARIKPAFAPITAISLIILGLVIFGTFNFLFAGTVLIYAVCYTSGIYMIFKSRKSVLKYFASPAIIAFLIVSLALAAAYIYYGKFYHQWDDLAHWGAFYKSIKLYGSLHQFTSLPMVHQAYMQGATVFYFFTSFFTGSFSEPLTFASLGILLTACSVTLLVKSDWKNPIRTVLTMAIIPLFFILFPNSDPYVSVSLDTLLGAYFGACLIFIVSIKKPDIQSALITGILCGALTQIKEIGFLLVLVCIVIYSLRILLEGNTDNSLFKTFKSNLNKSSFINIALVASSLIFFVYWKVFLKITNSFQDQFTSPLSGNFFEKLKNGFSGQDEVVSVIIEQFKINFLHKPVVYNGLGTPFLVCAALTFSGIIFGIWLWKAKNIRWAAISLWIMPFFFAAYLFTIFYTYVNMMTAQEGMTNASYERYVSTFFIAWIMMFVVLWFKYSGCLIPRFPHILPTIASCAILALIINTSLQRDFFNIEYTQRDAGRIGFDDVSAQMLDVISPGDNVWVITQGSDVLYTFMYHYTLMPAQVSLSMPYNIPGEGTDSLTPQQFVQAARDNKIDYILVYIIDEGFYDKYGKLFSDNLESVKTNNLPSLYAVTGNADTGAFKLKLATKEPVMPALTRYDDDY